MSPRARDKIWRVAQQLMQPRRERKPHGKRLAHHRLPAQPNHPAPIGSARDKPLRAFRAGIGKTSSAPTTPRFTTPLSRGPRQSACRAGQHIGLTAGQSKWAKRRIWPPVPNALRNFHSQVSRRVSEEQKLWHRHQRNLLQHRAGTNRQKFLRFFSNGLSPCSAAPPPCAKVVRIIKKCRTNRQRLDRALRGVPCLPRSP